ncbi:MAG: hypothetical protein QOH22_395 [Gemmatimonadaceae bacterium]|nr:hypothetical protein [Gemmatimonadaceae bacterium]
MHAPRSGRNGRSLHLVRVDSGALLGFWGSPRMVIRNGRRSECISGAAFHNAFRSLKPGRHAVGASFFPAGRNRREASLLALGLETEPTLAVLTGDGCRPPEGSSPSLRGSPAVEVALVGCVAARRCPAVNLSSLGRGGRNQPHLPPLALRIEKRAITHRQVLRRRLCAKV